MKKLMAILCLVLTFFIIYFLQADFFSWFTIAGVKPNIFIIFILFIGLFAGKKLGAILGLIFGISIDFLIGKSIGVSAIMLGAIGLLGEYFDKNFSKESRFTIMLMIMGCTIIYEVGQYVFSIIQLGIQLELLSFVKILFIEVLYNAIIAIVMYPLIQKLGYTIENIFKVKNVLTRYF